MTVATNIYTCISNTNIACVFIVGIKNTFFKYKINYQSAFIGFATYDIRSARHKLSFFYTILILLEYFKWSITGVLMFMAKVSVFIVKCEKCMGCLSNDYSGASLTVRIPKFPDKWVILCWWMGIGSQTYVRITE